MIAYRFVAPSPFVDEVALSRPGRTLVGVGRGRPVVWESRSAVLKDGRTIEWTWNPTGPHPQVIEARIDGEPVADRLEPAGTRIGHADVAAELLRSIAHPDGEVHSPAR